MLSVLARRSGWLLVVVLGASGCQNRDQRHRKAAEEEFSKAFSCPASSVTVTSRTDLKPSDLNGPPSSPPAEVAADPARLAEWQRRKDETRAAYDGSNTVQHASGCGHAVYYLCGLATRNTGEQIISCSAASNPPK